MNDPLGDESLEASLAELKAVYRVLLAHAPQHPELEGNAFVASLRELLEEQATAEGVDPGDAAAWGAWLSDVGDDADGEQPRELN